MAGYRETFAGNVDYAYGRGVTDMTSRLQRGMATLSSGGSGIGKMVGDARAAQRGIQDLSNRMNQLRSDIANATDPAQIRRLTREFEHASKAADGMSKKLRQMPFDAMEKGLGKLVKGLISMNTSILTIGFDFLISSIKRVYELQERWTKAIGGFNMRIGGMTKGLAGAQKAATQWSGVIRGLTDGDINEGIQMFAEFTDAIGRVVEQGDDFQKFGLQMARGFNLGGSGAGQLTKVLQNIGDSGDDAAETIKAMIKGANAAHVPTNLLAKDIEQSSVYMARFGKEGQKTFVTGAAWVRKYTISMEQLRNAVEGLDMFDEAAKTASKLNTAFGTMINSMDLMLEDDPAKRLEMIRQQFLAQGTTFEKLTPKQRRYLSETLKLTEDQTASLLSAKNAGESYQDFQAKAAKKEKEELSAKQMMEKQLRATAQTMYAFGAAFDRITVAIANAIKPLLRVLGLASDGDKKFTSFGQVMESITKTVEEFFNSLAKNEKWNDFMEELAKDLQHAGSALRDFVMDGRAADLMGDIARGMKSFYVAVRDLAVKAVPALRPLMDAFLFLSAHIKELVVAWGAMKVFNMAGGIGGMPGKALGGIARFAGGGSMLKGAGRLGFAALAGYAGNKIGGTGAGIGAGIGAMAGNLIPIPILGPIIGSLVGGLIGKGIEYMFFTDRHQKDRLERSQAELAEIIERETKTRAAYTAMVDAARAQQRADDVVRKGRNNLLAQLDREAGSAKGKTITLTKEEAESISSRAHELAMFSKSARITQGMLENLGEGSKLTKGQLDDLMKASGAYEAALTKLRETAEQYLQLEKAKLESSQLGSQKAALEALSQSATAQTIADKAAIEAAGISAKEVIEKFSPGARKYGKSKDVDEYNFQGLEDVLESRELRKQFDEAAARGENIDKGSTGYQAALKREQEFQKYRAKLPAKEQLVLDKTLDIRKRELENTERQKKLALLQTDFVKQQSIIQLRAIEMGSSRFLDFMHEHPEIKSTADAFKAYLAANEADLKGLYGASGFELLQSQPNFAIPKMASGGVVTRPTVAMIGENGPEAVVPLRRHNYASGGGGGDSATVVTTVADVHLDGQKVGRALVRTAITGRN